MSLLSACYAYACVIDPAQEVAFVVSGAGKTEMLSKVLEGAYEPVGMLLPVIEPASDGLSCRLKTPAAAQGGRLS